MEFEFEFGFIREQGGTLLGQGRNAVIWVSPQHRPAIMPNALYNGTVAYFALASGLRVNLATMPANFCSEKSGD